MKDTKWENESLDLDFNAFPPDDFSNDGALRFVKLNTPDEIILLLYDGTPFIYELAGLSPFQLNVHMGVFESAVGNILYVIWYVKDPEGNPFWTFDHAMDLANEEFTDIYSGLAEQSHIHMFLVGPKRTEIDSVEFENTFNLSETIETHKVLLQANPCRDLVAATAEFQHKYSAEEILAEPVRLMPLR